MTYIANFPNCGYIGSEFSNYDLLPIKDEINYIKDNFDTYEQINHSFTSTVKKEYKLLKSKNDLEKLILPFIPLYYEYFNLPKKNTKAYLETSWVNFQAPGEFFSPHTHTGDFSFVLYIQVPFFIEEEQKYLSSLNKPTSTATGFVFFYTDSLGTISPNYLPIDKTWENKIIFFPGNMLHSVQPFFTSDDFRISVSGNIKLKDD